MNAELVVARLKALVPLFSAAVYAGVFCYVYDAYLQITYRNMGFGELQRPAGTLMAAFVLAVVPAAFQGSSRTMGGVISSLIYALYYVPAVLIVHFSLDRSYWEVALLELALCIGMIVIFMAGWSAQAQQERRLIPRPYLRFIFAVTVLAVVGTVAAYQGSMRLVSFADVYDLRAEASEAGKGSVIGYAVMWLTGGLLPFAIARGLLFRERVNLALGILGCIVIYASTGAKSAILTPVLMLGAYVILKMRGDFFSNMLLVLSVFSIAAVILIPDEQPWNWIKALAFMRVLGTSGWTVVAYYDYFTFHGLTHLSHIGLINSFNGSYQYGPWGLGQVIGVAVSGNDTANFNAGFWASEGIAAFGTAGIVPISLAVAGTIALLNRFTAGFGHVFNGLWICGFAMSLLNLPFTTALVSGGGLLTLLMAILFRVPPKDFARLVRLRSQTAAGST